MTLTLRETRRRLRADRERLRECYREHGIAVRCVGLSPSYLCVLLYRYARYCYVRGWRVPSRLLWQLNLFLTGADIGPLSDLGEGLLIVHPVAVTITGSAGRNLRVEGLGGLGGGLAMDDIGAGPGLPMLGDDVQMARGAMVLGPVRVGDSVRIGPGCTVVHDVPDDSDVMAQPVRLRQPAEAPGKERADDPR